MPNSAAIRLNVFDGRRKPFDASLKLLVTLKDGTQKQLDSSYYAGPTINFEVPYTNGLADNYTVIVYAKNHVQAGFAPVRVSPGQPSNLDLMLLPKKATFNFEHATWTNLRKDYRVLYELLAQGTSEAQAAKRYDDFMKTFPGSLAAIFNIATATRDVQLPVGTALSYFKELIWNEKILVQDRFFAYVDAALVEQVGQAAAEGKFQPQWGLDINHPGATSSYKQKQFGEANLQFSFHENDKRSIDGVACVKVEMDMDYYKDFLAHLLLEVLPNKVSKGKTDPRQIYVLRWIAGRRAGIPEFDPPYTLEAKPV